MTAIARRVATKTTPKEKARIKGRLVSARIIMMLGEKRLVTPNDPKLSDRRNGRGTCRWVERR